METSSNVKDTINILFELIRNHKWNDFNELLDKDDTVDINVRDNQFNYLLTYAIRFNKIDTVKKLLVKGAKYDIVDRMERSIIHDALESNFEEIIFELLESSKRNVGI